MTALAATPNQLGAADYTQPCGPTLPQTSAVGWCTVATAAPNAGEPIDPSEDVVCVECAVPRWLEPQQVWRRGWSGEPLCAHCVTALELTGKLRGWAALRTES